MGFFRDALIAKDIEPLTDGLVSATAHDLTTAHIDAGPECIPLLAVLLAGDWKLRGGNWRPWTGRHCANFVGIFLETARAMDIKSTTGGRDHAVALEKTGSTVPAHSVRIELLAVFDAFENGLTSSDVGRRGPPEGSDHQQKAREKQNSKMCHGFMSTGGLGAGKGKPDGTIRRVRVPEGSPGPRLAGNRSGFLEEPRGQIGETN
jgi:hypothetical protein